MGDLSEHAPGWSWSESLAAVEPGRVYRIDEIASPFPREHWREMGIENGMRVRPLIVSAEKIVVELVDAEHRLCTLKRTSGWYVLVEPVGASQNGEPAPASP